MAETIRGINVVIGADTTALSKALSDVNKRSRDIQSELKQVERLLKLDPSNTELVAQKQKLLADAIENAREKLDRLRSVQEQVNEQFRRGEISEGQYRAFVRETEKTRQELEKLEQQLRDMEPAIESFGEKMQKAGDKLKSAGEKMADVGKKLSVGVTAPIVGIGTVATKAAVDFESAFAGVRKTVDATEEEFAQLEQGIRDMSKQMPAAATDIAAVAEAAGQLGIETDNILKFTETMIGLGEATNLTAEEGATQFARFANIVGMSQNDFDRLGSAVVALGNNFATTEAEIVAMGMRLAGQGAQIGMTEAQIMALAAAMSSVGIEAEAGGTAMSMTLKKMQTAVSLAGEDLDKFAKVARMSAEEFAAAFSADPAAALQAFVDGLAASSAAGENLTLILNDLGISGIRESDTLLRLAGANDVLRGALETATQAWEENTALQNEVAQRYATTESQMAMFKNQLQDVAITLGQALIPALMDVLAAAQPMIETIASAARWFANLDDNTQKTIITIAGIAAAVGPVLVVIGKLIGAVGSITAAFGGMATAGGAAAAGTAAAGTAATGASAGIAAMLGPIGLAVAALAGLAAAAVLIVKNWEPIKDFFKDLWDGISSYLTSVWRNISESMADAWKSMLDIIRPILEGYKTFFSGIWDAIKNIFAGALLLIIDLVTGDFTALKNDAEAIWNNLKDALQRIWDGIKQVFNSALDVLKQLWSSAWNTIKSTADTIWQAIRNGIQSAIDWIKSLPNTMMDLGKDMIQGLVDGIKGMIGKVGDTIKSVADTVTGGIKSFLGISSPSRVLMQLGEYTGEGFAIGLRHKVDDVRRQASSLAEATVGALRGLPTPAVGWVASTTSTANTYNFEGMFAGANFVVRNDNDIRQLARELGDYITSVSRGRGIR